MGRKGDEAELGPKRPWFHREDGAVLPFKENLQNQNQTSSFEDGGQA